MKDAAALLRPGSLRILEALLPGPQSLADLSRHTGLTKPALYRYLNDLVEGGVVLQRTQAVGATRVATFELVGGSIHLDLRPKAGVAISWATPGPVHHDFPLASQIAHGEARGEVLVVLGGLQAGLTTHEVMFWANAFVILFGSFARGQQTWKSDIDLLFVSDSKPDAELIQQTLDAIEERVDHRVQVHFATRDQFLRGARTVDREAAEDGMVLHDGYGEDELWARMARYKRIWL